MRSLRYLLPTLGLCLLPLQPATAAEDGQRVILVLDASGSMWGQIDGKTKMDIAKATVGKVVGTWKAGDEIGLVAYGHRQKGSCDDIEVLIEPGAIDSGSFMEKVKALAPKGKTPMTQAVRQAAEALKFTEKQATVILVSDGIETCDPNPCAVAEELEKLGVGLTVHTVGFGLDDKGAVAQLQCLAEKTGGISVLASNADELEQALTRTVEAKAEPEPAPPAPEPVAEAFNIRGEVVMAEGVGFPQDFSTPNWEFFTSVNGERGEWVKTEYGPKIKTSIEAAGDHIARISLGAAALEVPFTLEQGKPVELDVSLEAGIVRLSGKLDEATPLPESGPVWELLSTSGNWIATNYGGSTAFIANAGAYRIRLTLGEAKIEQDITVTAGKTGEVSMTLGAGAIEATAVFAAGGPAVPDGATVELRKGEAALDGSHEWISTSYTEVSRFSVPAGKYLVVVSRDHATGQAEVEVKPGAVSKVEVNLDGGFLAIDGPDGATIEVFEAAKDIAGNRKHVDTDYNGDINKAFEAGSYHAVLSKDGAVIAEKTFEVKAGQRTEGVMP